MYHDQRRTFSKLFFYFSIGVLLLSLCGSPAQTTSAFTPVVTYVDKNSPGPTHDGTSWTNAYLLIQDALDAATYGSEIWVAQGVYIPTDLGNQHAAFHLVDGVAIYGGFGGVAVGETIRSQRDWLQYKTILSGDLAGDDVVDTHGITTHASDIVGQNAYHVVISDAVTATTILDGFTIIAGKASGTYPDNLGGGLLNMHADPTLSNLAFIGNDATLGGGLYNTPTHLYFDQAIYVSNSQGDDTNGGSQENPKKTIAGGIAAAIVGGLDLVRIQVGTYDETVQMSSGINIEGGYDLDWVKGNYEDETNKVLIVGGMLDNESLAVLADGLDLATTLSDVVIDAPDANGSESPTKSSYGVVVNFSDTLYLENVTIHAGIGADGDDGDAGSDASQTSAADGSAGGNAYSGSYDTCNDIDHGYGGSSGIGPENTAGGIGGDGGTMDTYCDYDLLATAGQPGEDALISSDFFGNGGYGGDTCLAGESGEHGIETIHGIGGLAADDNGTVTDGFWVPSFGGDGGLGEDGAGGGGGGGSGGCDSDPNSAGAGGGGGGAGGLRAPAAGTGGYAGGASIGILAAHSTLQLNAVTIERGYGGHGGNGGNGGVGQPGGIGGTGGYANGGSKDGGFGGNGSAGGDSGGGAGGNGGDSIGILDYSSIITENDTTYLGGIGGYGGDGGLVGTDRGLTGSGESGTTGTVYTLLSIISRDIQPDAGLPSRQVTPVESTHIRVTPAAFTNLIFTGNSAVIGGGLYNQTQACLALTNGFFQDNAATNSGGAIYVGQGDCLVLTNLTAIENSAIACGGALHSGNSSAVLQNSILWNNTAVGGGAQICTSNQIKPLIRYSDIQGSGGSAGWDSNLGTDGGGNIDANPLFIDVATGQFGLQAHSPARNAGSNTYVTGILFDLLGNPRILDGRVDMGAIEQLWLGIYLPLIIR